MKHMKESSAPILSRLLSELVSGASFPVRRGASFGLAGCVKGFGIACLKSSDVMAALEEAAQSKSPEARQGALFAFETLSESLGLLFEPYVIRILPYLLKVTLLACLNCTAYSRPCSLSAQCLRSNIPHLAQRMFPMFGCAMFTICLGVGMCSRALFLSLM